MKVSELQRHLAACPEKYLDYDVEVWLPGSTIRLSPMLLEPYTGHKKKILIEGNLNPGSALGRD